MQEASEVAWCALPRWFALVALLMAMMNAHTRVILLRVY